MNIEKAIDSIVAQLKDFMGDKTAVVGLSGGIDSSVIAYLLERAISKGKIFGVVLPYGEQDSSDGKLIASELGISCTEVNIKPIVDEFPCQSDRLTKGNIMARARMTALYAYANIATDGGLVIGTTNKTEAAIGYFTKWGDGAVDVEPIADLYKTEVWEAAKILGVPQKIIDKKPSAELWDGQTDEDELGMTYEELDQMLKTFPMPIHLWKEKFGDKGMRLKELVIMSEHKRHMPPAFKLR